MNGMVKACVVASALGLCAATAAYQSFPPLWRLVIREARLFDDSADRNDIAYSMAVIGFWLHEHGLVSLRAWLSISAWFVVALAVLGVQVAWFWKRAGGLELTPSAPDL